MKNIKVALILVVVLMLLVLPVFYFTNSEYFSDPYQELIEQRVDETKPGVAVLLSRGGEIEYIGARGMSNLELGIPLKTDSVFRIGSISKQFTAAAIMILLENDQLALDDDIHKYIPNYPTEDNVITIYHLLTHTSGLPNYTEDAALMDYDLKAPLSIDGIIHRISKHPMRNSTGQEFSYSNTGYVLLGKIIEVVSGKSYQKFIDDEIFQKLDMQNSYYGGRQIIQNRASGYGASRSGHIANAEHVDMSWPYSAGALLSTVEDLNKWFSALRNGTLISQESYKTMTTPGKLNSGRTVDYGFGLDLEQVLGANAVSHGGAINGFTANLHYLIEYDLFVVALSNYESELAFSITKDIVKLAIDY
jgi:CubicO group peptidase (beta-lactamase class C family)